MKKRVEKRENLSPFMSNNNSNNKQTTIAIWKGGVASYLSHGYAKNWIDFDTFVILFYLFLHQLERKKNNILYRFNCDDPNKFSICAISNKIVIHGFHIKELRCAINKLHCLFPFIEIQSIDIITVRIVSNSRQECNQKEAGSIIIIIITNKYQLRTRKKYSVCVCVCFFSSLICLFKTNEAPVWHWIL